MLAAGWRLRAWPGRLASSAARRGVRHGTAAAGGAAAPACPEALGEISGRLSKLTAASLNGIMRQCGLGQGTSKAHKVEALSAFVWGSQQLALQRYLGQRKRLPLKCATAHKAFVPEEVVSIDIGFRNLAFAHVARGGRVLAWQRVELLKEATFEPWALAAVVEAFVRDTLPVRPAAQCTYIIEHQRFRSQGSANVTNSVMVNNLIEALLYANLRHCGAHIEAVNPTLVSIHWRLSDAWDPSRSDAEAEAKAEAEVDVEAEADAKPAAGTSASKPRSRRASADKNRKLALTIAQMDGLLEAQKRATAGQHDALARALGQPVPRRRAVRSAEARNVDELQQRGSKHLGTVRDLRRRLIKKERSISLVQSWVLASLAAQQPVEQFPDDMWPFGAGQHMAFADGMGEMFYREKKKDDLCDCIVQAVAWYRWQHAVAGILDTHGSDRLIQGHSG
ncbi:hypothetical protein IWQ57_004696 [Coemansia nantahalensis]|uniref:Uncharacterized protein n=1 Tax=Coemansia nantahalensis TaxID=2789366 RepID=A0ACC1JQZ8_9FUNG|nr:hypothetical protein IWQ57_004696 [Coemansia nantahalensis]